MTPEHLVAILGAFGSLLSAIGIAGAWLINRVDANAKASQQKEADAREKLAASMQTEINELRAEVAVLRSEKSIYLRRIYMLELFIHQTPGLEIPAMEGWPP